MHETEPQYFKKFREHIDDKFAKIDDNFSSLDKKFATKDDLKGFATKADLELMKVDFERHVTDLTSGFNQKLFGMGDYVKAIDEKVANLDMRVAKIDNKKTDMQGDIFFIKETVKELAYKKDVLDLKKRMIRLETQKA